MTLTAVELHERFALRPLMPDALTMQQSRWRQRWGLPPEEIHTESTDWKYHIDAAAITGHREPNDPRLRLLRKLQRGKDTTSTKYFLTGSRGAGKSTTAYSLWLDEEIRERYCLIGCSIKDYLNLDDMDAGQVIAVMIAHLIATIQDAHRDADLGIKEAKDVIRALTELLKQAQPDASLSQVGVNVFGLFSAQFKKSEGLRKAFDRYVDGNFDNLMALFDRLVSLLRDYKKQQILFVIDDLDKIGSVDINNNVFQTNLHMLLRPRCAVLYTFPLELHHDPRFNRLKEQTNRYVLGNIKLLDTPDGPLQDEGLRILRAFITSRLDGAPLERHVQLSAPALGEVFRYTCGNYRELSRILQFAFDAQDFWGLERANTECFNAALRHLREDYNPFLQRYGHTLDIVRRNAHRRSDDRPVDLDKAVLSWLIQSLSVVEYPNDPGWLDVHPILKDLMDSRASVVPDAAPDADTDSGADVGADSQ